MTIKNVFDKKRLMAFVEGYTNAIDGAEINICPFAMSIQNLAMFLPDYDAEEFRKNFFCGWKSVFVCDGAFAGEGVLCGRQGIEYVTEMECVKTFLRFFRNKNKIPVTHLKSVLVKLGTIREDSQLSDEEIRTKSCLFLDALLKQAIGIGAGIYTGEILCPIFPKKSFFGKVS